jgi:hypothetical protein
MLLLSAKPLGEMLISFAVYSRLPPALAAVASMARLLRVDAGTYTLWITNEGPQRERVRYEVGLLP